MRPDHHALIAYTTGVLRARAAYRADRLFAAGICTRCEWRRRDQQKRECQACVQRLRRERREAS